MLSVDAAIPCGLIVNELVSNSLEHAFPAERRGEVCVDVRSGGDSGLTLIVSDDGVGLPSELDFRKTESLGLQLVSALAEQLDASIELDRSLGTEFRITFTESSD